MAKAVFPNWFWLLSVLLLLGCSDQTAKTSPSANASPSRTLWPTDTELSQPIKVETKSPVSSPTKLPTHIATVTSPLRHHLQLVFKYDADESGRVYALSLDCPEEDPPCVGKPELLLRFGSYITSLNWSPNGEKAVVAALGDNGRLDIYVIDFKGQLEKRITRTPNSEVSPTWLPDGKHISYNACVEGKCGFVQVDLDTNDLLPLLDVSNLGVRTMSWSPDGKQVAFAATIEEPFSGVFVAKPDGSNLVRLTSPRYYNRKYPVFSPDGEWIAFIRYLDPGDESSDIYLFHPDGTGEFNLTNGMIPQQVKLAWSPIGDWIAFNGCHPYERCDLYIIRPDGSVNINLSQGEDWELLGWRAYWAP